ncbi:hypothetical protein LguiB_006984 [Lonicera macranthoides]
MSRLSTLCIISLLLISVLSYAAARPQPAFLDVTPMEIRPTLKDNDVEENCSRDQEECLMRRTLEAHIDYIYTQKQKQP